MLGSGLAHQMFLNNCRKSTLFRFLLGGGGHAYLFRIASSGVLTMNRFQPRKHYNRTVDFSYDMHYKVFAWGRPMMYKFVFHHVQRSLACNCLHG